MRKGVVKHLQ